MRRSGWHPDGPFGANLDILAASVEDHPIPTFVAKGAVAPRRRRRPARLRQGRAGWDAHHCVPVDAGGLPMAALEVRLFGKVFVEQDGRPVSSLSAKALELLCYLLVYRDRAHTREALAGVLWPEASYPLSKKYLRQTLWQLQTTLGSQPGDGDGTRHGDGRGNGGAALDNGNGQVTAEGLLLLNPGWVRLNPGAGWWLDVEAFEDAYARCRDLPGHDLTDAHAQALEEAVVLYQGDLIE